jgi:hypothetical protein
MDKIIELLMRQPIVAFFLVVWVIGAITNAMKAKQKIRERSEAKARSAQVSAAQSASTSVIDGPSGDVASRSAVGAKPGVVVGDLGTGEQKKLKQQRQAPASMRGRDRQVIPAAKSVPAAKPATKPVTNSPEQVAREMRRLLGLEPDLAPPVPNPTPPVSPPVRSAPVESVVLPFRDSPARAEQHVESHVGESMRDRHMAASKVGTVQSSRGEIGSLGGRTKRVKRRPVDYERRYAMTDLRRIVVMNEILSPPITLRQRQEDLL